MIELKSGQDPVTPKEQLIYVQITITNQEPKVDRIEFSESSINNIIADIDEVIAKNQAEKSKYQSLLTQIQDL